MISLLLVLFMTIETPDYDWKVEQPISGWNYTNPNLPIDSLYVPGITVVETPWMPMVRFIRIDDILYNVTFDKDTMVLRSVR